MRPQSNATAVLPQWCGLVGRESNRGACGVEGETRGLHRGVRNEASRDLHVTRTASISYIFYLYSNISREYFIINKTFNKLIRFKYL